MSLYYSKIVYSQELVVALCSLMSYQKGCAGVLYLVIFFHSCRCTKQCHATDTITQGQQLSNSQSLVSAGNIFELGFFKPDPLLMNHYLGIWSIKDSYKKMVWVANGNNPINDSSGVLMIDEDGTFQITYGKGELLVLSSRHQTNGNLSATLMDSGNLVLRELNSIGTVRRVLWQSFDHPSTMNFLPQTEPGENSKTGSRIFSSHSFPECRTGQEELFNLREGFLNSSKTNFAYSFPILNPMICQALCWKTCDCSVFNIVDYENGTMCVLWEGEFDLMENTTGNYYYVLTSNYSGSSGSAPRANQPDAHGIPESNTKNRWWMWSLLAIAPAVAILLGSFFHFRTKSLKASDGEDKFKEKISSKEKVLLEVGTLIKLSPSLHSPDKLERGEKMGHNLHSFSYAAILAATNNFSPANKLGHGGFGAVYKGILRNGQEIAVKRLSKSSRQGLLEFKNEIMLISKLQHTNLVRLLGCCIHDDEKMLIYEFMPNNSLSSFLFDPAKRLILDWKKRFAIIEGITQGLLYLHKYSRFRVIHRDLKASNILLDNEMNPKIADFGMARIFGSHESEENTNRIVGTYGYMSPEYAMDGIFSVKSDVFSFGVILLEIISGKKTTSFSCMDGPLNLVVHAWDLWKEGKILELVDQTLSNSCSRNELLRCLHVGLLCVQESAVDRPTMSDVVSMLTNETMVLALPKQPAFCSGRSQIERDSHKHKSENFSLNDVSVSTLKGR